jgi:hypothetical protein
MNSIKAGKKKARFDSDEETVVDRSTLRHLENICPSLSNLPFGAKGCLGFVLDENMKFWGTYPVDRQLQLEVNQNWLSLEALLSQTPSTNQPRALNKRECLYLAVNLASSLLQLHTTPWLPENWCNKSIHFPTPVNVQQPYVIIQLGDSTAAQDGQVRFVLNPYLVSLGIILLELSERKSFHEWLKGRQNTTLPDNVIGKATIAWDWFDEACWNMSEEYAIAVQYCLKSSFIPVQATKTLSDEGFREAVYRDIVSRLQREYIASTTPLRVANS